jgi:hypothetical protein
MGRMERFFLFIIPVSCLFLLGACATMMPATKGALVDVYRPNPVKESMVCSVEGKSSISYMYVGADTISGKVTPEESQVIAQYARSVLGETRFINPVAMVAQEGEYPNLSIRVHQYSVKTRSDGGKAARDGIFEASFSIRQAGLLECATGAPILIEKHYEMPAYKKEKLPSNAAVAQQMVKEAVQQVVRQFVPVKSKVLRPVKSGSELSGNAAAMIDAGNCLGAYEMLKTSVNSPACNDADTLYNAGVALECWAWSASNDQKSQYQYLKKAGEYYGRAAMLKPGDGDIQKAKGELDYELNTFFSSFDRQDDTKKTLESLKTPKGF